MLEDIAQGIERLQSFIPQIEDLGRDGFPYLEGARARTELQLKECIKKTFGDKSPEFQAYRQHRLSVETPADTKQTVALLKSLIGALEDKKLELQGLKPPPVVETPPPPPATAPTAPRPSLTLVPSTTPSAQVTITPAAPVLPPPITMSVALTTNLDMTRQQAAPEPPPSMPAAPQSPAAPPTGSPQTPANQHNAAILTAVYPPSTPAPSLSAPLAVSAPKPVTLNQAVAPVPPQPSLQETQPMTPTVAPLPAPASMPTPSVAPETKLAAPDLIPPGATPVSTVPKALFSESSPASKPTSSASGEPGADPLEMVKSLCKRFHMIVRQLRLRGEYRATLNVEDELDAQDLLHALLRVSFDDIETSEWVPDYANGTPRVRFLLNDGRLAVIVKKTRSGLNTRDLMEQLRADIEHCRTLKGCSTLLYFVYDPEGRIGNPRGLETDLISISDQLTVDVYVAPK
ncbi:conserved protein of unknown function [Nitrospira japonica]|uniref:Uncharacterized protein n=1 Tax=Nitrospira japonica TaxID=1325564 RepID=A0A1W1I638_9BACT|nr:hypothetical protein [Nitrospira japonica]SLM48476.1 conserved protein of unknown function [Nitrospira japonica]